MAGLNLQQLLLLFGAILLGLLSLALYWFAQTRRPPTLRRLRQNPILSPIPEHWWESEAVFNPAALYLGGRVHLLYRALGQDGISRIGYASSPDGIHFDERIQYAVYTPEIAAQTKFRNPFTSPARMQYDHALYASGGGWGGSEDPRMVAIDGRVYVTFNMFNGWDSMQVGLLSIDEEDFKNKRWHWSHFYLSPFHGRHKNWILFPEKIHGKFALFHNLHAEDPSRVRIEYFDEVETPTTLPHFESPDPQAMPKKIITWHDHMRSAGAPPIKTEDGWLLFYHAMDKDDPNRYKVGALLLDLDDPTKILYRSQRSVLEPDAWYENDWKPGIIYSAGAVVVGKDLILYYGGGDKRIAAARANLRDFLRKLTSNQNAVLEPVHE